jgi:hypothetical protein
MKASVWVSSRVLSRSASERRGPRSRTASPWTVAHVGYSMLRRRAGSRSPAWTRSSSAAWRCCNGCRSSFVSASGWSAAANAVSKRPGSLRANPRYALPTAWSRSRPRRCVCPRADLAHPVCHALSEPSDRLVAHCREQRVAVGEVAVGGIGNDPDHARHLAQHDGVRPARPCELDASLDERGAHSAAGPRSPAAGPIARLRVTHLTKIVVDSVHNTAV